jgi:hypothetical protein
MSIIRAVQLTVLVVVIVVAALVLGWHLGGSGSSLSDMTPSLPEEGPSQPDQAPDDSDRITFTIALDRDQRVGSAYNLRGVPITVLIDEDGIVRGIQPGAFLSKQALTSWLDDLISSEAPSPVFTEAPAVGYLAPDFTLATVDGGSVTLSQLRDRWVLVNFWTTWCTWCIRQMPYLQAVFEERGEEIEFIGVNWGESEAKVRQHLRG